MWSTFNSRMLKLLTKRNRVLQTVSAEWCDTRSSEIICTCSFLNLHYLIYTEQLLLNGLLDNPIEFTWSEFNRTSIKLVFLSLNSRNKFPNTDWLRSSFEATFEHRDSEVASHLTSFLFLVIKTCTSSNYLQMSLLKSVILVHMGRCLIGMFYSLNE